MRASQGPANVVFLKQVYEKRKRFSSPYLFTQPALPARFLENPPINPPVETIEDRLSQRPCALIYHLVKARIPIVQLCPIVRYCQGIYTTATELSLRAVEKRVRFLFLNANLEDAVDVQISCPLAQRSQVRRLIQTIDQTLIGGKFTTAFDPDFDQARQELQAFLPAVS